MLQRNLCILLLLEQNEKLYRWYTSAVERAVRTVNADERYTLFKERLQGRCDS